MTVNNADIPAAVQLSKEDGEETGKKSWLPEWAKLPKWTPTALIGSACFLLAFATFSALNVLVRLLMALHESSLPWWGVFWVYAFIGGALFRASKEFAAWAGAAQNRWGVFTRWSKSLV
ncbi:hypothetical protein ACTU45_25850 [Streptomyces sp. 24-1644]|uniref:hypothetical protein n=1 Tax=Streptomyces sp. 24-1644 TaxID=3457315 RepID=UPI003FA68C76